MATTNTYDTSASDGYLQNTDANYTTGHDAAVADGVYKTSNFILIGQNRSEDNRDIMRSFLYFDTSGIPDDATILSAKIRLKTYSDKSDTDFNIVIRRNEAGTYPSDPLVTSDFDYTFYVSDGGSINSADLAAVDSLNYIHLNDTGLTWINKTGVTKLALISSRDINVNDPSGKEYIGFYAQEATGASIPQLSVTYAVEEYPTVTTQAATVIKDIMCVGNGTLTDGLLATEYGFEYGLTETPTWKIIRNSTISESSFALNISGLTPSTTYYYRAYATNSYGTAYGGWVSFTTSASPSYGIHEESNTATICFYISEDDGMTWGQKHGPYTTDQADIEITKLLVRGSGKKKIKFTSDVLTGISASIMCKLDLKAR